MPPKPTRTSTRRRPQQRRSQQTVDAILDAVLRTLKRNPTTNLTTNHIAEVAGVSIGSVYQYFPDKRAIFIALHERHISDIDRIIQGTLIEHAASPLDTLIRALIEAMIDAHTADPELFALLATQVPHRADTTRDFSTRLHGTFRLAIASRERELQSKRRRNLDKTVFVVTNMVDALSHAATLRRPANISLAEAKEEAVRAVLAYLHA